MTKTGLLKTLIKEYACPLQLSLHLLNVFLLSKRSFYIFYFQILFRSTQILQAILNYISVRIKN